MLIKESDAASKMITNAMFTGLVPTALSTPNSNILS